MSKVVYLNKPSKEIVLDLINLQSTVPITLDDVIFETPVPIVAASVPLINRNTRIRLTGTDNQRFTEEKTVYYNRLNIQTLFGTSQVGIPEIPVDFSDALRLLNFNYGLAIQSDEVYPQELVNGNTTIRIKESLVYEPESEITLVSNTDLVWFENAVDRYWFYVNTTLPNAIGIV